jgi:hypothetical protein
LFMLRSPKWSLSVRFSDSNFRSFLITMHHLQQFVFHAGIICITGAIGTLSSPAPWIFGHPHYEVQRFIQKRIIRVMSGLRPRNSCRDAFRNWRNIAATVPVYIFFIDICCE